MNVREALLGLIGSSEVNPKRANSSWVTSRTGFPESEEAAFCNPLPWLLLVGMEDAQM